MQQTMLTMINISTENISIDKIKDENIFSTMKRK